GEDAAAADRGAGEGHGLLAAHAPCKELPTDRPVHCVSPSLCRPPAPRLARCACQHSPNAGRKKRARLSRARSGPASATPAARSPPRPLPRSASAPGDGDPLVNQRQLESSALRAQPRLAGARRDGALIVSRHRIYLTLGTSGLCGEKPL